MNECISGFVADLEYVVKDFGKIVLNAVGDVTLTVADSEIRSPKSFKADDSSSQDPYTNKGRLASYFLSRLLGPLSLGCRTNPNIGLDKKTATAEFKKWWESPLADDITIFSDGSKQYRGRENQVRYGFATIQNGFEIDSGSGSINTQECFYKICFREIIITQIHYAFHIKIILISFKKPTIRN